jgi:ATP-dependent protease ClpP protease subunit
VTLSPRPSVHQLLEGQSGTPRGVTSVADIEIQAREILDLRKRMDEIYAHDTGQDLKLRA